MAELPVSHTVRPLHRGQVTIPIAIRRALGITESSLLRLSVEGDRIIISKLTAEPNGEGRVYSDEEIAAWVREYVRARLE